MATRVLFATDIHGSERCFRKFIKAGPHYRADVLIMGGDLTGKIVIPIVQDRGGKWSLWYMGREVTVSSGSELEELKKDIRFNGYYYYLTTPEEVAELEKDKAKRDELFLRIIVESVASWLSWASERLANTGIRCFVTPGNDDTKAIDAVFSEDGAVINPEGRCLPIDDYHLMISTGYSNPTPWNSPRECSEDDLAARLEAMIPGHEGNAARLVLNCHAPPFDTRLDDAPELTADLAVRKLMGRPAMTPVGSRAVREFIKQHEPFLGLHGHIHESPGRARLGKTLCLNPGSEYTEGILRAALFTLERGEIRGLQFVSG